MKKHFIIYAPAINPKSAGAHSILESFLSSLGENTITDNWQFVGNKNYEALCLQHGIRFSELDLNLKWVKRIIYDFFLFKRFFLKKSSPAVIVLSMQNTTPRLRPQDKSLTYLHQAIPFIPNFYPSPIKQTKLLLIKHFYYFFISYGINRENSFLIVQSEWLKKIVSNKLQIPIKHIFIHRPLPTDILPSDFNPIKSDCFFYPAIYQVYKNHHNLIKAFGLVSLANPTKVYCLELTLEDSQFNRILEGMGKIPDNLTLKNYGVLNRKNTLQKISNAKAVIYPSLLESYGMPIAEALFLKTPVLASKLPYAEELLKNNGIYFDPLSPESIKDAIIGFDSNNSGSIELPRDRFQKWQDILESFTRCL